MSKVLEMKGTPILARLNKALTNPQYKVFVFEGGSRSSKTYSIIQFFIIYALTHRNSPNRIVIARKKATWLAASVWTDFQNILITLGLRKFARINKTLKIISLCSTTFEFIGLDDVQKLHGLTTDIFWINEAMEALKNDFDQLEQRTSRFCILDYNPSAEEHWIYDNVCNRNDCYFDHSSMLDNPFIPENSRRKILSYEPTEENILQGTADERKWKIYGLGLRATIEGLVFKKVTLIPEIPQWVTKRWYGIDFGFAKDETACVEVGYYNNGLYVDEKFYQTGMLTKDIISRLRGLIPRKIISESADPRMVRELQNAGLSVFPVRKGAGSIEAGIDYMQGVNIYVTEKSLNIIKEFNNYTYQQLPDGRWTNMPVDAFNHGIDSIRYIVLEQLMGKDRNRTKGVSEGIFI